MPAMANITVKKSDGTTDKTFTAVNASGGDGKQAVWRDNTIGSAVVHRPELRAQARDSSDGKQRVVQIAVKFPQIATNSTTSLTSVVNTALAQYRASIPKDMAAADVKEFSYQTANLIASALLKAVVDEGSAP